MYYFEKNFTVTTREEERFGRMRPSALLGFLQETAAEAAVDLGVGRETLMEEHNAFWMLVRVWFRLNRPVRLWEQLRVRTWHRGNRGMLMYRDFDLYVGEELVGEAVSVWVLADFTTRQMRPLSILNKMADTSGGELCKKVKLSKLRAPQAQELDEVRRMHNSDCDVNAHVNNTRYADFVTDALHVERLEENQFVSQLQIGYLKECLPGEDISVLTGQEDGLWYVHGMDQEGVPRFDAKVEIGTVLDWETC